MTRESLFVTKVTDLEIMWYIAIAFFGIGDLVTTFYAMSIPGLYEANPFYAQAFTDNDYGFMVAMKMLGIILVGIMGEEFSKLSGKRIYRQVAPVTLAILGIAIVTNNLVRIYLVT